jgi:PKHD-type hydroxylase
MNKVWTEPVWKSLIAFTKTPIFTKEQCDEIIKNGKNQPIEEGKIGGGKINTKTRLSHISWIPFNVLPPMYERLESFVNSVNNNHFGFDGICLNEMAQYTEYQEGGFYDWHMDSDVKGIKEPTVRKISMTCLLSHESEFEGGGLELLDEGNIFKPSQGHAVFFASFLKHRVVPVTKGVRKSLVVWFGGPSFK